MIEKILRDYLTGAIAEPVYMTVPGHKDKRYVTIERTGGYIENCIRHATVAIQSIAESQYEAAALHETVIGHIMNSNSLPAIGGVYLNAEYNFPNEVTKEYRYQALFEFTYYTEE